MELITEYCGSQNSYSKKIRICEYTEGQKVSIEIKGVKDICELIIGNNEMEYNTIEKSHRHKFIVQKKLEIAESLTTTEKYSKKFTIPLIQNGFQEIN